VISTLGASTRKHQSTVAPASNDFYELISALTARLRECAAPCPTKAQPPVREQILACAAALERISAPASRDEGELQAIQQALDATRADLAAAQIREKQARHLAMHDALTGLPNRRYFQQRLDLALSTTQSTSQSFAVLYVDLNGFKAMNDTHGHHMGDLLLQIVAARLNNSVRAEDMVCRLGGDEFGCLLTGVPNRGRISQVAAKISRVLSAPMKVGALDLVTAPSIGIAVAPGDGGTSSDLLHRADVAMYHAKHFRTQFSFFREAVPQEARP
jgi:diguanylate cyclase